MQDNVLEAKKLSAAFGRTITFDGGALVPLQKRHTQHVIGWRNDSDIAQWFISNQVFTVEGHETWLAAAQASGSDFNWIIEDATGKELGTIGLYNLEYHSRRAEVGRILIGVPSYRGSGFARKALISILELAKRVDLIEIYLFVLSRNTRAISLYQSLGFHADLNDGGSVKMRLRL